MQHRLVATRRAQLPGGTTVGMLVAGAWLVVLAFALTGNGGVIHHARLIQGGLPLWIATVLFLVGWQVMLWAMMMPASLDAIQEREAPREKLFFITGYGRTSTKMMPSRGVGPERLARSRPGDAGN